MSDDGKPRVSVRMTPERLSQIDDLVDRGYFMDRSEAIRSLTFRAMDFGYYDAQRLEMPPGADAGQGTPLADGGEDR